MSRHAHAAHRISGIRCFRSLNRDLDSIDLISFVLLCSSLFFVLVVLALGLGSLSWDATRAYLWPITMTPNDFSSWRLAITSDCREKLKSSWNLMDSNHETATQIFPASWHCRYRRWRLIGMCRHGRTVPSRPCGADYIVGRSSSIYVC